MMNENTKNLVCNGLKFDFPKHTVGFHDRLESRIKYQIQLEEALNETFWHDSI